MHTIMLVEDHPEIGRLMRTLFELEGYRVVVTNSYDEILPLLSQTLPDAILMDVQINGQETIDLVRQMRQSGDNLACIPVAMTSAWDCRRECLEAGANEFIPKPFLPDEVVQEIGTLSRQEH
jgi:CheY-like chemotaxis protein